MRTPDFWFVTSRSAGAVAALLSPIGAAYGFSVRLREWRARPRRARAKVVCIGNLTAGGSGKTPIAIAVANRLASRGKTVFLTRGYGGRLAGPVLVNPDAHSARDTGDEPLLLAQHAPTIVARDRTAGAELADRIGAAFVVMDDGFQNFGLAKDLAIIVVDAETGFGNGHLIPGGPLREPVSVGLRRADAIVLMGDGDPHLPPFDRPILRSKLVAETPERWRGQRIMAFAGIGRPEKFFATLAANGLTVVATRSFPDHHQFTAHEVARLKEAATAAGAVLMTTAKDLVRLDPQQRSGIFALPVRAEFESVAMLDHLLERVSENVREPA